jgi:hypothetical protein
MYQSDTSPRGGKWGIKCRSLVRRTKTPGIEALCSGATPMRVLQYCSPCPLIGRKMWVPYESVFSFTLALIEAPMRDGEPPARARNDSHGCEVTVKSGSVISKMTRASVSGKLSPSFRLVTLLFVSIYSLCNDDKPRVRYTSSPFTILFKEKLRFLGSINGLSRCGRWTRSTCPRWRWHVAEKPASKSRRLPPKFTRSLTHGE